MNIYRKDFPLFKAIDEKTANENNGLIYFDSAATSQRPYLVLDAMNKFYREENANPLRGLYELSERATLAYENSRKTVADFLNAKDPSQIIFTRNATESLNLVAYSYGLNNLKKGEQGSSSCGVAQMNPTNIPEDAGSIPGLAQWVRDLVLPRAVM